MCSRALTHPLWKCTLLSYSWLTYLFFWQHESSNCHRRTVLISFILMVVWSHVWETCGHSFNSVSTSVKATVTIGGATLCALCIDITVQFELDLVRYNRQLNSPAQLAPREKHNCKVSFKKKSVKKCVMKSHCAQSLRRNSSCSIFLFLNLVLAIDINVLFLFCFYSIFNFYCFFTRETLSKQQLQKLSQHFKTGYLPHREQHIWQDMKQQ